MNAVNEMALHRFIFIGMSNLQSFCAKTIKKSFECGTVRVNKRGQARYSITNIKDLTQKIIPFFEQHPLHAKKRFDFELWKEAVEIFSRNQRIKLNREKGAKGFHKVDWNPSDIKRLEAIHQEMKKYKSKGKEWKWLMQANLVLS